MGLSEEDRAKVVAIRNGVERALLGLDEEESIPQIRLCGLSFHNSTLVGTGLPLHPWHEDCASCDEARGRQMGITVKEDDPR